MEARSSDVVQIKDVDKTVPKGNETLLKANDRIVGKQEVIPFFPTA
jgi:hypothetical protein